MAPRDRLKEELAKTAPLPPKKKREPKPPAPPKKKKPLTMKQRLVKELKLTTIDLNAPLPPEAVVAERNEYFKPRFRKLIKNRLADETIIGIFNRAAILYPDRALKLLADCDPPEAETKDRDPREVAAEISSIVQQMMSTVAEPPPLVMTEQ